MEVHAKPTFDDFSKSMRSARQRNIRGLHLTGHGSMRCGFYWLKRKVGTEYEEIAIAKVVGLVRLEAAGGSEGGTIEFALLNACETEEMGRALRAAGVRFDLRHVVRPVVLGAGVNLAAAPLARIPSTCMLFPERDVVWVASRRWASVGECAAAATPEVPATGAKSARQMQGGEEETRCL